MISINIASLLNYKAKRIPEPVYFEGNEAIESYENFEFPDGLDYDFVIWPGENKILLLTGQIEFKWVADCDLCLEPVENVETIEIAEDIYPEQFNPFENRMEDDKYEFAGEDEEYEFLIHDGRKVDLTRYIIDTVYINLPLVVKCSEDCPGLCVNCGKKDLENHECKVKKDAEELKAVRPEFDKLRELL